MWFMESAKVHANCFRRREFEAISVCPDREFIETALNVSLDDVDILDRYQISKSSSQSEHSTPGEMALTIELIFRPNKVTERILP